MNNRETTIQPLQTTFQDPNIKDQQYVVGKNEKNGTVNWTLKTGTKLSDVFYFLPSGIINKTETGIGATTLELASERNSIIVEPIKITASSKAQEHGALYIGSPTRYHRQKTSKKDIIDYLADGSVKYKKIVVVADSLPRVYDILKETQQDFFLMIDEADSFQLNASFRRSMGTCIDIYKKFPRTLRALITATLLEFSDPELQHESQTVINYQVPQVRNIDLFNTSDVDGTALERVGELLQLHRAEKIMIAYNSVSGCYNLARHLVDEQILSNQDVKILCSANSEKNAKEFFSELDSFKLPGRVTFITSAYFTGFDLKEDFHLISVSSSKSRVYALSDHNLKQIAGRCRNTLLSETVIYSANAAAKKTTVSKEELIVNAEKELIALNCIEHNFSGNIILEENIKKIRELIISNTTADSFPLVRQDISGKAVIDYLNIDAYLEGARVMKHVYSIKDDLPKLLVKEGHNITKKIYQPNNKVINHQIKRVVRQQENLDVINDLRNMTTQEEIDAIRFKPGLKKPQKEIINTFLANWHYVHPQQLLDKLEEAAKSPDSRKLNNIALEIFFATLDDLNIYKRNVCTNIQIGQVYSPSQLLTRWNKIFSDTGLHKSIGSEITATKITKMHFDVKRDSKKGTHRIMSPKRSIDVVKSRPEETSLIGLLELHIDHIKTR